MLKIGLQKGDTLIEVLLAITVFSMVSVGAMTIMNQGTSAAQRALEITLVRQQVDAQAEALRAAQQAHTASADTSTTWSKIIGADSGHYTQDDCPTSSKGDSQLSETFIMDARYATKQEGDEWLDINEATASENGPHAQVVYAPGNAVSTGIWIEREQETSDEDGTPAVYNFTVRACWEGAGMSTPMRLETVVRLYDPS